MIEYINILEKLKSAGYNTTRLRKEKILSESTLTRIRKNESISIETLNTICNLTNSDICDIIKYYPD